MATPNEFLLLTLLAEGSATGYDLERKVRERRLREWTTLGMSGLYYLLEGMKRRGWVAVRRAPGLRGPARRVASLTARGRRELRRSVRSAFAEGAVDLALMNLHRTGPGEMTALLEGYAKDLELRLREARRARREVPRHRWSAAADLIFDRHEALLEAEGKWARRAARVLERRKA